MIRTGYSFHTAVGHLSDVISRCKECGYPAAPIADRCSTFAFVKWTALAQQAGLRPCYGVELGVVPALGAAKPVLDYWTFMAKDDLRPLHELIYKATANPGKEPSLTYAQALTAPGVIRITGERAQLAHCQPQEDLYVGLSPATPKGLYAAAKATGYKFCAMANNYFPLAADREFYRVTLGIRANDQSYSQHITTDDEWRRALIRFANPEILDLALATRNTVTRQSTAELKKASMLVPAKPQTLRHMCAVGAASLGVDLTSQVYAERLAYELDVIKRKNFEDYFYIVADIMQFARQRMIVGPGRGSSSGSLMCYLLGITAIDPIPHELLFERFFDEDRQDPPDIDIDLQDDKRHLVFKYVEDKYGKDRVARLGSVNMFKPRSALHQARKALQADFGSVAKVMDNMIIRSSGDSRAMQQLEDTLQDTEAGRYLVHLHPEIKIASRMEGHPFGASQHAAGVLITKEPIMDYVAVDARTGVAMVDKKDAEVLNLLKIDALGLTQLGVFGRTLELIGERSLTFLEKLPLDDQQTFDVLNQGHFAGVFQFMGRSLKNLVRQSGVSKFNDMVNITALSRPGPMGSGGAAIWTKRKEGKEPIKYPHDMFKPYLEESLGVVIYQEQVMKIVKDLGGLSWKQVKELRKAMSKSLGTEFFDQYGDPFKKRVIANGLPANIAETFWVDLCKFGLYGFNKSHALAYAIVSYWCCWLKAHHPLEFAAASLDNEDDPLRQIDLLQELSDEGIEYIAVDPARSTDKWQPINDGNRAYLLGPLTNIEGVGPQGAKEIMAARINGGLQHLPNALAEKLNNAKTPISTLSPVTDRVRQAYPDLRAANIHSQVLPIEEIQCGKFNRWQEVVIIGVLNKLNKRDENEAINIEKRKKWGGGKYTDGLYTSLGMFFKGDRDEIYAKIDRKDYERLGVPVYERGKVGRAIYVVKGTVPQDFRMIRITNIKYLCDLEAVIAPRPHPTQPNDFDDHNTGVKSPRPL